MSIGGDDFVEHIERCELCQIIAVQPDMTQEQKDKFQHDCFHRNFVEPRMES